MSILLVFIAALAVVACDRPQCIRSHRDICHRDARQQPLFIGTRFAGFIHHPAYDYECVICDEYEASEYKRDE